MSSGRNKGSLKVNGLPNPGRSPDIHEAIHVEETFRRSRGPDLAVVVGIVWMFVGVILIGAGIAWSTGAYHGKDLAWKENSWSTTSPAVEGRR